MEPAGNEDVTLVSALERGDLVGDVVRDDRGVVPRCLGQCRRDDDLRHAVHPLAELAGGLRHRRPVGGEAFVRDPAEELGVTRAELLELELLPLGRREAEGPAAVLGSLRAAGIVDHAVQRDEFGDDQHAHGELLPFVRPLRTTPVPP
jgi:hypothetical protein